MAAAKKMLKRTIKVLPKLVRGSTRDKPWLLLLIGAEKACVHCTPMKLSGFASLIYVGSTSTWVTLIPVDNKSTSSWKTHAEVNDLK